MPTLMLPQEFPLVVTSSEGEMRIKNGKKGCTARETYLGERYLEWLNNSWFDNNALQISEGSRGDVDVVVGQDQSWLGVLFHYCFLVFPSKCPPVL